MLPEAGSQPGRGVREGRRLRAEAGQPSALKRLGAAVGAQADRRTPVDKMASPCVELSNKMKMPLLGLGTWQVSGRAGRHGSGGRCADEKGKKN